MHRICRKVRAESLFIRYLDYAIMHYICTSCYAEINYETENQDPSQTNTVLVITLHTKRYSL